MQDGFRKLTYFTDLQVSKACTSICQWVRAMHKYHFVAKAVEPKREALRIAQDDLAETQRILDAAKQRLKDVENGLLALQSKYGDCVRKKQDLETKTKECEARLVRADKVSFLSLIVSYYLRRCGYVVADVYISF